MSPELQALLALAKEPKPSCEGPKPGDMYRWPRLGAVALVLATKGRKGHLNWIWLYHFHGSPSLYAQQFRLRDFDPNCSGGIESLLADSARRGDRFVYVGNLFDRVPHNTL